MTEHDYRKDFPLLQTNRTIYIDNAATAQKPAVVIEAEKQFYEESNANPLRGFYPLSLRATEVYENARVTVRDFIHADSEKEIIFTRNTTEGLNLVAYSYACHHLKPGDEIAVTIMEHHSNLLPWQMAAQVTGATLRYLECEPDGTLTDETLEIGINEHTRLLAVGHVSNVLGCVNPVRKMADRAHAFGAVVMVDAAQSAPHMPIDVHELQADFLAFSGHKLMAPMGIGVLYGKEALLEEMPPFMTGGEMISSVSREGAVFAELPHKFEAGTVNAAGAAGLAAAIHYIEEVGFETIEARELQLTRRAMEGLAKIPHVHVIGSEKPENHTGIVAFTIEQVHPHDVSEILAADGIDVRAGHHCAQPLLTYLKVYNTTRASFMFYNTPEEVDAFVKSVSEVRRKMGYGE
ncbi:cysteine desulfurase SufS subfamily [Clostridium sp. CAG:632]|nr:cysteine desulfurase SufS subfamily [Clostridium sp. CAG:632]